LVFTDEARRQFVQIIKPLIGNLHVDSGQLPASFVAMLKPLLFAGENALRVCQATLAATQILRIGDLLPGTEYRQVFQATSAPTIAVTTGSA
jgi:hypothetical protein